jgi:hypothetical protein
VPRVGLNRTRAVDDPEQLAHEANLAGTTFAASARNLGVPKTPPDTHLDSINGLHRTVALRAKPHLVDTLARPRSDPRQAMQSHPCQATSASRCSSVAAVTSRCIGHRPRAIATPTPPYRAAPRSSVMARLATSSQARTPWLDHLVHIPRFRPIGWALTIGPVVLVASLSRTALAATTGIATGVVLLGTAATGFYDHAGFRHQPGPHRTVLRPQAT